jgi:hypothetical protein
MECGLEDHFWEEEQSAADWILVTQKNAFATIKVYFTRVAKGGIQAPPLPPPPLIIFPRSFIAVHLFPSIHTRIGRGMSVSFALDQLMAQILSQTSIRKSETVG